MHLRKLAFVLGLLLVSIPASAEDVVPYQAEGWKYLDVPSSDPVTEIFFRTDFDDSAWATGQAAFGSIDGYCPIATTIHTSWPGESELLLRRTFTLPELPPEGLKVYFAIDNDAVVYINGMEVFRANSGGCPNLDDYSVLVEEPILIAGDNLLAFRATDGAWPSFVDIRVDIVRHAVIRIPGDQPTIQAGINAASDLDTVLVAPGVYTGPGNANGLNFNGKDVVLVSEGGPSVTEIDAQDGGGWLSAVNGEGRAVISGFTVRRADPAIDVLNSSPSISDCVFADCVSGTASNIVINGPQAAPVISDCQFVNNEDDDFGAAVAGGNQSGSTFVGCDFIGNRVRGSSGGACFFVDSSANFVSCVFRDNWAGETAGSGGAIAVLNSSVNLGDCILAGSTAYGNGGAVYVEDGSVELRGCTLIDNVAVGGLGGAISAVSSDVAFITCSLVRNSALAGAGVGASGGSSVTMSRTIIAFSAGGSAVRCLAPATAVLTCSDVYGNPGGDWTNCLSGQLGVGGNFSSDPMFCDLASGNLVISGNSPCSPQNTPGGCGLVGAWPIGCETAAVAEGQVPPIDARLSVSPNPTRRTAEFILPGGGSGILSIFDSQGRLVQRLTGNDGRWVWTPGASAPAGVYFARLEGGSVGEAVKFLRLR